MNKKLLQFVSALSIFFAGTIYSQVNLSITKTVDIQTPAVGTNVTFTIVANNPASSTAASGVRVTDVLPSGYTYISSLATGVPALYDVQTGFWNIGTMASGASATLAIIVRINAAGDFKNIATISATQSDTDLSNNTAVTSTDPRVSAACLSNRLINPSFESPVQPVLNGNNLHSSPYANWTTQNNAQLNIIKVNGSNYAAGQNNAHEGNQYLDIAGANDYPTQSFTITEAARVTYSGWFANREGGAPGYENWIARVDILNGADVIVATSPTLNFVTTTPKEIWYYVSGSTNVLPAGTYRYRAFVGDYGHFDNAFLCTTPLLVNVGVTKTVSNAKPGTGTDVTFTITASNSGPDNASGVVVKDLLQSGYSFVSATPSAGVYDPVSGDWSVGNLANAASATLSITATVLATGSYGNTATISSVETDSDAANNTATVTPVPICYNSPNTSAAGPDTTHGISLLQRAGAISGNWPMIRKSAHTVLESNTKGFVISRMTTTEINAIVSPQEGMMLFDTTMKCLKINTDGSTAGWSCFNATACP